MYHGIPRVLPGLYGQHRRRWHRLLARRRLRQDKGDRTAQIAPEKVRALFEAFREVEFFWLFDKYAAEATHVPLLTTTLAFDGHTKTVIDYAGNWAGMPQVVHELRCVIDQTANTAQWIGPPDHPARQLRLSD